MLANTLVPVVSTIHLVVRWLIGISRQDRTSGNTRTYPKSEGSSMTPLLELLFAALAGQAQYPSQSLLQSTAQSSLHASTDTTTKPSRKRQPPRVTSTTGLQHEHLVPLDALSQCNRTRIALTLNRMIAIKRM